MKLLLIASIVFVMLAAGCSATRTSAFIPESRLKFETVNSQNMDFDKSPENLEEPIGVLSLENALRLALFQNPQLVVYSLEIRAREANNLQISLLPNPEIGIEIENFTGSGIYSGMDASEMTISLGQLIELGGKRQKRTALAALDSDLAAMDFETVKLEIYSAVIIAYTKVLALQEKSELDKELLRIAIQLQETIHKRVLAGGSSPAESARANVFISYAENNLNRTGQGLKAARKQLASMWNGEGKFDEVAGNMDTHITIPSFELIMQKLEGSSELLRWTIELKKRKSSLELSKAMSIPDPTISLAYRRINESKDQALIAGLAIPLTLFDRNQGSIQEAQIRLKQGEWEKRSLQNNLTTRVESVYINAETLNTEISVLKEKIVPNAEKAYSIINDGYRQGKFQLIDVLDAQRTLFEAKNQLLQSLLDYRIAVNELELLTG